jgi:hypothetical protein
MSNLTRLRFIGAISIIALILVAYMAYTTTHYLSPSGTELNKVIPEVLILYSNIYEGKRVAFTMRVGEVRDVGTGIVISGTSAHGRLDVYYQDKSVSDGIYINLSVTVVGVSHISTKGYVDGEILHPNFNILTANAMSFFGLLFLIYYTYPFWTSWLRRWKVA